MSYLRKGLRQSQFKNVIERDFVPKKEIMTQQFTLMSPKEKSLFKKTINSTSKGRRSDWIHFGYTGRSNFNWIGYGGLRNYNSCITNDGKFRKIPEGVMGSFKDRFQDLTISRSHIRFKSWGDSEKFYHITSPKNWDSIRQYGLIRSRRKNQLGYESETLNFISSSEPQVWNSLFMTNILHYLDGVPYVVLEVDPKGIHGELMGSGGDFFCSELVTHVVQNRVLPQYIKYVKTYHSSIEDYENFQNLEFQKVRENSDQVFMTQSNNGNYEWNSVNFYDKSNTDQINNRRISLNRDRSRKTEYKLVS